MTLPGQPQAAGAEVKRGAPARFGQDVVVRGLACARTGEVVSLNLPLDDPKPPFGRAPFRRTMRLHNDLRPVEGGYIVVNDDEVSFALQGSSQWDALAHFGTIDERPGVYFGGAELDETYPAPSSPTLGIQALGPGVVTRGVLIDVVRHLDVEFLEPTTTVNRSMVEAILRATDTAVLPGDAVLVFTGMEARRESLGGVWPTDSAGLDPDTIPLWRELDIQVLVSDNLGIDPTPSANELHRQLLRGDGVPLGELWALRHLAARCAMTGRTDFALVGVPLNIPGAFGSPANAIAIL